MNRKTQTKEDWKMKKFVGLTICMIWAGFLYGAVIGTLPELAKPTMITVEGNELYVNEGSTFFVYSLADLKLLRTFGRRGEGPGELLEIPYFPNKLMLHKNQVFVTCIGKIVYFSREGEYIKESRTNRRILQMMPVGNNYVAQEQISGKDNLVYLTIVLYNSKIEKVKELYRQKWIRQGNVPSVEFDMSLDFTSVAVTNDKIFIEESPKGFLIEVFNSEGDKLYEIKKDYEKREITANDKEKIEQMMREDPGVKADLQSQGGWDEFKKYMVLVFPDYFPPIKGIEISGDKLYVRTNHCNPAGDKEEYLIMDLKGNILKKKFISRDLEVSVFAQVAGGKLFSINNDRFYYIIENENEEWELHIEPLD